MNWSDIGGLVGRAAPVVGTLLGGPAGAAVGALVASALNVPNDPEAVNKALAGNPDAMVRIQELQLTARVELEKLAVQAETMRLQAAGAQYAAEAADRDSARKLAAQQPRDFVRPIITFIMLGGSLFIVAAIILGLATDTLKDPTVAVTAGTILGIWLAMTKECNGFWFGMTKESQKQNAIVTDFAVQPGTVTKPDK